MFLLLLSMVLMAVTATFTAVGVHKVTQLPDYFSSETPRSDVSFVFRYFPPHPLAPLRRSPSEQSIHWPRYPSRRTLKYSCTLQEYLCLASEPSREVRDVGEGGGRGQRGEGVKTGERLLKRGKPMSERHVSESFKDIQYFQPLNR